MTNSLPILALERALAFMTEEIVNMKFIRAEVVGVAA